MGSRLASSSLALPLYIIKLVLGLISLFVTNAFNMVCIPSVATSSEITIILLWESVISFESIVSALEIELNKVSVSKVTNDVDSFPPPVLPSPAIFIGTASWNVTT